jgi:hypothetical protein
MGGSTQQYVDLGDIDTEETEPIKIEAKSSGIWWLTRSMKKGDNETKEVKEAYLPASPVRPTHTKAKSEPGVVSKQDPLKPRSNSTDSKAKSFLSFTRSPCFAFILAVTTIANAPTWLLNACNALDYLTTEHPKVMTTISAVLITVGSIPAIPAISAGAGGAALASGAAHAVGAIAVGVGSWLRAQQDGQMKARLGDQSKSTVEELQGDGRQKAKQLKVEGLPKSSR